MAKDGQALTTTREGPRQPLRFMRSASTIRVIQRRRPCKIRWRNKPLKSRSRNQGPRRRCSHSTDPEVTAEPPGSAPEDITCRYDAITSGRLGKTLVSGLGMPERHAASVAAVYDRRTNVGDKA